MSTTYLFSDGATFSISPTANGTFTVVNGLKEMAHSGSKQDTEDTSTLQSVGRYREYAKSLRDAGQFTLSGNFLPTDPGQIEITAAFDSDLPIYCKLQLPPFGTQTVGNSETFAALVTERPNITMSVGKTIPFNATLKITGPITPVAGS